MQTALDATLYANYSIVFVSNYSACFNLWAQLLLPTSDGLARLTWILPIYIKNFAIMIFFYQLCHYMLYDKRVAPLENKFNPSTTGGGPVS